MSWMNFIKIDMTPIARDSMGALKHLVDKYPVLGLVFFLLMCIFLTFLGIAGLIAVLSGLIPVCIGILILCVVTTPLILRWYARALEERGIEASRLHAQASVSSLIAVMVTLCIVPMVGLNVFTSALSGSTDFWGLAQACLVTDVTVVLLSIIFITPTVIAYKLGKKA